MKKQKSKGKAKVPEWVTAEQDYDVTGKVCFAALAIGHQPINPPGWALKACQKFSKSLDGQILNAAFAIGQAPDDLPQEAIDICRSLAERSEIAHEPVLKAAHPGPKGYDSDDELLEQMTDLVATGMSVRKAALKVTGDYEDGSNARRLQRKWANESSNVQVDDDEFEDIHPREDRGLARRASKQRLFPPKP